jgi:transcriptional regulator with XRE-family HTH domain
MPHTTMPDRPVTDFGERLRQARHSRGISLRQVANVTRITVRALEAVERNDLSRLPGGIFTRSFVRAYAAEVGLDPEGTLREFLAQCPEEGTAIPTSEPSTIDGIGGGSWVERVPLRQIAVGLLLLALAGAAVYAAMRWK